MVDDGPSVDFRAQGGHVRPLGRDGVVGHHCVGHSQDEGAVVQAGQRFAYHGVVGALERRHGVDRTCIGKTFVLPRDVPAQYAQQPGKYLLARGFRPRPHLHGAVGHGLHQERVTGSDRRMGRQGEDLTDVREGGAVQDSSSRVFRNIGEVGQGQRALRATVGRALLVPGKDLRQPAVPRCDHDKVILRTDAFQVCDFDTVAHQGATALGEQLHPGRHLHALVDRLGRLLQMSDPGDIGLGRTERIRHVHGHTLDQGRFLVPERQSVATFPAQCGTEEALGGSDPTCSDLLGPSRGDECHVVALGQQADRELETGLARSDDENLTHVGSLLVSCRTRRIEGTHGVCPSSR